MKAPRATKIHRRIELVVALLCVVGVALILSASDQASAADEQTTVAAPPAEPGEEESPEPTPEPVAEPEGEEAPEPAPEPVEPGEEPAAEESPAEAEPEEEPTSARGAQRLRIASAKANPERIFLGSRRRAAFRFELSGERARKLLIKVVKVSNGAVQKRFRLGSVQPGELQRVVWDGKLGGRKGFTSQGEHAFRVFSEGERAAVSRDSATQRFDFYGHRFPLLGRHTYGDGFGAGRGHQGVDVLTRCGTPVVAARGGRVQTKAYQSSAGYYVVVDGRGTGRDYVYMHLGRKSRVEEGSWLRTGERIGLAQSTGNATTCMLHFELWSKPGWYEGGSAKSATKTLKRWDRWS